MSNLGFMRHSLKRSFTESDVVHRALGPGRRTRTVDSEYDDLRHLQHGPGSWSELETASRDPPPLPPRPLEDNDSTCTEILSISDRTEKRSKIPLWTRWRLPRRKQKTFKMAEDEAVRNKQERNIWDDFISDKRGWRLRFNNAEGSPDSQLMMSGALPKASANTLAERTFLFSSPDLVDLDRSDQRSSSVSQFSFYSNFDAECTLQPSGFQAFSDIFSQQGIHELSRCTTPMLRRRQINPTRSQDSTTGFDHVCGRSNPPGSIAAGLPTELIQSIYGYLGAFDFNAARHTCHTWMYASLHLGLLTEQLKRGGWWSHASKQSLLFQEWRQAWPMSCYLARECALTESWKGQDLDSDQDPPIPMTEKCFIDFQPLKEAATQASEQPETFEEVCSTSTCGKYYLTACDTEIYTYEIEGLSLRLVSRTSCERRVLAMSIDAGPERFAIAAVLESRIGLHIDLLAESSPITDSSPWETSRAFDNTAVYSASIMDFGGSDGTGSSEIPVGDLDELSLNAASIGSSSIIHQSVEISTQRTLAEYFQGPRARLRGMRRMPASANGIWPDTLSFEGRAKGKKQQVETPPQLVYRNLCTEDDPPRSVAISPTRQCVAFGCKTGVELYWVDATTGQNLNRWFPLTKPSDHLHFLPPRRNIDSALRLRLISSAAYRCPNEDAAEERAAQTQQSSFWATLNGPWRLPLGRTARQQAHNVDHSHAVPLSDGHHILFTDNETGLLCLGSDTPIGALQRLSRKFVFEPPPTLFTESVYPTPTVYAAAQNLSNGVRVVAGYGDKLVLYSVPVDALRFSSAEQEETLQDSSKPLEELEWLEVFRHPTSNAHAIQEHIPDEANGARFERLNMMWTRYLPRSNENRPESLDTLWPLRIAGICIGSLNGLKALSVQDTVMDGLVIRAFSSYGLAKAWEVDDGKRPAVYIRETVGADGVVREAETPDQEVGYVSEPVVV